MYDPVATRRLVGESGSERRKGMSTEVNKAIVRRFFEEVYNRGNLEVADELMAPDVVDHDMLPGQQSGVEGYKRSIAEQRAASSDLRFSIEDMIAEGEKVVTRSVGSGTHDRGELMGVPPTGKRITVSNITITRLEGGKIVEEWTESDTLGMMRQLGLVPEPGDSVEPSH
jgi:steroid delta-isomerase-like uncharacterized protein